MRFFIIKSIFALSTFFSSLESNLCAGRVFGKYRLWCTSKDVPGKPLSSTIICYYCGSDNTSKFGFTKKKKQRYLCRSCHRYSSRIPEIEGAEKKKQKYCRRNRSPAKADSLWNFSQSPKNSAEFRRSPILENSPKPVVCIPLIRITKYSAAFPKHLKLPVLKCLSIRI